MFEWSCEYSACDATVRDPNAESYKRRVRDHLLAAHRGELRESFREQFAGRACRGRGCEYAFPGDADAVGDLTCPDCGHDHARYWAGYRVAASGDRGGGATASGD